MSSENVAKSNEVVSNQIYYKPIDQFAPRYKDFKVWMSNIGGNTVPLTATGTVQVQFKLPYNTVLNLAKSKFVALIPVPAQQTAGPNYYYSQTVADCWPFGNQTISLETGNGLQLLNLTDSSRYTKVLTKINTSFKDYITTDVVNLPHPSLTTVPANNANGNNSLQTVPVLESNYFFTSVQATAGGLGYNYIPVMYELSNFSNTILALDKDTYFGNNDMYLKLTIGGYNSWCYQTTTAAPNNAPATLSVAIQNLQNVYLYLAVEQNPIIIDKIISQYNSHGLKLQIDYPIVTKIATQQSTSQSAVINFPPANGKFLKKIVHSVYAALDTYNTALDNENSTTNAKTLSYYTSLDNTKLQDDTVITLASGANTATNINEDDWRLNKAFCRDSVILNQSVYSKNWFHCDDFTSPDMEKNAGIVSKQNLRDGLPMERAVMYTFAATTANSAFNHLNFAIFIREVLISKEGVMFV